MPETSPGSGWCPPVPAESVGDATFVYQTSAYSEATGVDVVSVGTSGTVGRRVKVDMISQNGKNVFADEHLIGQDEINIEGDVDVETDIGTNGDVTGKGKAYFLCGNVRHGTGKTAPQPHCEGEVFEGNKELPQIEPPEDFPSNCRLVPNCTGPNPEEEEDTYTKKRTSSEPWDAGEETITIAKQATLTMGGSDYLVCGLFIKNGELIMLDNTNVRIFVKPPEECGMEPGDTQVQITGNGVIKATGYAPELGSFDVPGIFVLGAGKVVLDGTSGQENELLLYAPYSEVDIGGNATWIGMIAGRTIRLHGNPTIISDPGIEPPAINLSSLWERTHYVECTGPTATPPDAFC